MLNHSGLIGRIASAGMTLLAITSPPLGAAVLNVPADFATIQGAINAARVGDEVVVATGTYRANLQLRAGIDLRGAETARTFLRTADNTLPVIQTTNISNVLVSNFTFIESANAALLTNSTGITLANNVFDSLSGTAITVGIESVARIENNAFYRNNAAINRFTTAAVVINNLFAENTGTLIINGITPVDPDVNVSYNCFYRNTDLEETGIPGTNFQRGDPLLTDPANRDFHLRQASPCIDTGIGTDVIDDTVADIGAYGGEFADPTPFWLPEPIATNTSTTSPDIFNIQLSWDANESYLITNTVMPGSYRVWYQQNRSGPPFEGTDANNGTEPSPIDVGDVTSYRLRNLQPDVSAPGATVLVSATPQNQSVTLSWRAAAGAGGYRVNYGTTLVTENELDIGNITEYTVNGLTNKTQYIFAVTALTQPVYYLSVTAVDSTPDQNESDFSPAVEIEVGNPVLGPMSAELRATPSEIVPYPNLPDDGCFIATAAFGADWAAEVLVLRQFRDRYLARHAAGRAFIAWYYRNGPVAASYLNEYAELKPLVRAALWPLIALAAFLLGSGTATQLIVVSLLPVIFILLYRSSRRSGRPA